jgi:hypothetical protein
MLVHIGDVADFKNTGKLAAYLVLFPKSAIPTKPINQAGSQNAATNWREKLWCNAR